MNDLLHTDPEIMRLSIPISQEQSKRLESSIIENGCLEPIVVWNGIILDGHKRYKMCSDEGINFDIREKKFKNLYEAAIWVCYQRIKQYDKFSIQYCYLVGKLYSYLKVVTLEQRKESGYHENHKNGEERKPAYEDYTSFHLGNIIGLHRTTVQRYRRISEAMDKIDQVEPMLFKSIMEGRLNYKNTEIIEIAQMDNKRIERIRQKKVESSDIKMRSRECKKRINKEEKQMKENNAISISTGIKKMPVYDPDMAIRGLTLTIPMWISAIERAEQQTDMTKATDSAKMQLGEMLIKLDDQIQKALEVL
ncbi:hypothetical protein [Ruminococcus flavefaciens]|uniref:hypothetical protein n=1 Tax=Ruminococcus flavefaciens TaxID=1265 RepID=UPI00048DE011|nr:hypothetical protein [Ruminococcus flavefaciens]